MSFEKISVELHESESLPEPDPETIRDALNVDYSGYIPLLKGQGMAICDTRGRDNRKGNRVLLSPVDTQNKYSTQYYNCLGIAAIGTSKVDGEILSLLAHMQPRSLRGMGSISSLLCIKRRLQILNSMAVRDSIDCVLFGGRVVPKDIEDSKLYRNGMKALARSVERAFDFEPVISLGPSTYSSLFTNGYLSALIENKESRLNLYRKTSMSNDGRRNLPLTIRELDHQL